METILAIIVIIIAIIFDYVVAKEFERIAAEKGFAEKKYFYYSFIVPAVGYLMVIALPDHSITKTISVENNIDTDELPTL